MATLGVVPRRPHIALTLRVPPELHARLTALVEREHRSLTAQTLYLLEQWADQREEEERRRQAQGGPPDVVR